MDRLYHPGEICPVSGQWTIVNVRTRSRTGRERTVVKREPFPPTPAAGQGYLLVDATRT
jgi:hypothetical protein